MTLFLSFFIRKMILEYSLTEIDCLLHWWYQRFSFSVHQKPPCAKFRRNISSCLLYYFKILTYNDVNQQCVKYHFLQPVSLRALFHSTSAVCIKETSLILKWKPRNKDRDCLDLIILIGNTFKICKIFLWIV